MIKELVNEISKINNENYNSITCQKIEIMEYDFKEGTLYFNFNDKLNLKITHNSNKGFLKFEVLKQDEKFWSQDSSEVFSFEAQNGISIISDFYLDIDKAFSYIGLLGNQSLINDGVTIYLPKFIAESETHHINKVMKILEALMDWSYNAPEFNVKEKTKEVKEKWIAEDYFRFFSSNQEINDVLEITGFNYCEDFDKESSLITIKFKKGV